MPYIKLDKVRLEDGEVFWRKRIKFFDDDLKEIKKKNSDIVDFRLVNGVYVFGSTTWKCLGLVGLDSSFNLVPADKNYFVFGCPPGNRPGELVLQNPGTVNEFVEGIAALDDPLEILNILNGS